MMTRMLREHKKLCIIAGSVLGLILLIVYLCTFFRPGVWHQDTFLYKKSDGSFAGSDSYADYQMHISPTEKGADISFTVNNITNEYEILSVNDLQEIEIYKNGIQVFKGSAVGSGDYYLLMDEDGSIQNLIGISTENSYSTEGAFPEYNQLYNWAIMKNYSVRGNLSILAVLVVCAVVLILDIVFPNLFFTLQHRLAVDGGEPSDWYRTGQMISRIVIGAAILICMVLSFTTH